MPFKIVRNDITKMNVDVIVNTANNSPKFSTGVDAAVYKAAGEVELLAARQEIGRLEEGDVAITPGFKLPAKYIIHAVSPRYLDGESGEENRLRSCYRKSLELAYENQCKSIAFPLISTGNFGYPKEEGMRIAVDEINAFLLGHDMLIYLVVFDAFSTRLGKNLYPDLEAYIDQHYVVEKSLEEYVGARCMSMPIQRDSAMPCEYDEAFCCDEMDDDEYEEFLEEKENAIQERMKHLTDNFQEYLFYLIKLKKLDNVEVYSKAFMDKRQFSKIKNNPNYHPDKATALRLCIGARLNIDQTKDLLARAGYALSPCDKRDVIFSYFIEKGIYDFAEIDITLEEYGLPCFVC